MLKFYNTMTRKKEIFTPAGEQVKMYSCGPTVYSYPHIGNMRAYIFMDSLRRTLKYNGYKILGVMNITDVGHLTSDEDTGDDKMELAAKKENKSPYEIAKFYTDYFFKCLNTLNIDLPEHILRATENIDSMIELIKTIEKNGFTYRLDDGIYFDVKKFKNYGRLSGKNLDICGVARIEENTQKHHPFDFALWKFVPDSHIMKWDSPWGIGCPGWHIECSAMGMKILGETIDIHTGGIEHSTVHHENEIAQNESAVGHPVVRFWMHNQWLLLKHGKMGKSLGNAYTLDGLKEKGYNPMALKYLCHTTLYRKALNFTFEALDAAQIALNRLYANAEKHKTGQNITAPSDLEKFDNAFLAAINDDLNIPKALAVVWEMLSMPLSSQIYAKLLKFDEVLGLNIAHFKPLKVEIPQEIIDLAAKRRQAKANKDYALSDKLRQEITQKGYQINDLPNNQYKITKI